MPIERDDSRDRRVCYRSPLSDHHFDTRQSIKSKTDDLCCLVWDALSVFFSGRCDTSLRIRPFRINFDCARCRRTAIDGIILWRAFSSCSRTGRFCSWQSRIVGVATRAPRRPRNSWKTFFTGLLFAKRVRRCRNHFVSLFLHHTTDPDIFALSDQLFAALLEDFNTEAEDGSLTEVTLFNCLFTYDGWFDVLSVQVAETLVALYHQCRRGNLTLLESLRTKEAALPPLHKQV